MKTLKLTDKQAFGLQVALDWYGAKDGMYSGPVGYLAKLVREHWYADGPSPYDAAEYDATEAANVSTEEGE